MLEHITMENFKDFIASKDAVIIDFWATWCGPCRMLTPVLEELNEKEGIKIGKINTDEEEELAGLFRVEAIPTILIFKDSKLVAKTVGFHPYDDLKNFYDAYKNN